MNPQQTQSDETPTFGNVLLPAGAVGLRVLSLFDGMSCGQQALEKAGMPVKNYFASEIDKYAIQVTMANYPNTIQLGSVVDVDVSKLPKIDLLLGGSPCQSFSFAGKRKGMSTKCETEILTLQGYLDLKSQGFEFEGQSYLFWEYMRILTEIRTINPDVKFLLENVEMGDKWEKVLSRAIGVNGIHINSALVSAQNRKRIYWTNIGMQPQGLFGDLQSIIQQPKDRGILLKDILQDNPNAKYYISSKMEGHLNSRDSVKIKNGEDKSGAITPCGEGKQGNNSNFICCEVDEKYFLSEKAIERVARSEGGDKCLDNENKSMCLISGYYKQGRDNQLIVHNTTPRSSTSGKGGTGHLSRNDGKTYCLDTGNTNAVEIVAMRGRGEKGNIEQQLETNGTNKSNSLTSVQKDNLVAIMLGRSKEWGAPEKNDGKSYTLCKEQPHGIKNNSRIRRLTPIECERLQTVNDNYTNHVSDSQRYKMLGNGWTVDVIAHILSYGEWS